MNNEMLTLTQDWDKTFPQSEKVDHKKVTFRNRYGITLAADMYIPKNAESRLPAIAVSGPFSDACGARISDYCLRPVVYGRKRRNAEIYGVSRYKHRGFSGGC